MKKLLHSLAALWAISRSGLAEGFSSDSTVNSYNTQNKVNDEEGLTRKGFRLGLDVGGGNTSVDDFFYDFDYSETGFATTLEIWSAPTNQVPINYLNNVNWVNIKLDNNGVNGLSSISVVTLNYYIENQVNTVYVVDGAVLDSKVEIVS